MSRTTMREVAVRVFAREFSEATHTFRESDEDRAPVYVLLPTGAKANRVFVAGALIETENLGDEVEYWRGRVVDPVSAFFVYAGQYQPEAVGTLRELAPPEFVAVVGKPRTFETDAGTVTVSLQPESVTVIDEGTRNRWVVETAERTIERIERFDAPANEYAAMALKQYDVSIETFRQDAIQALESLEEPSEMAARKEESEMEQSEGDKNASTPDPPDEDVPEDENDPAAVDDEVIVTYLQDVGGEDAVDRETLIMAVREDYDTTADAVEVAIEEALESGRCFRAGKDDLTPI